MRFLRLVAAATLLGVAKVIEKTEEVYEELKKEPESFEDWVARLSMYVEEYRKVDNLTETQLKNLGIAETYIGNAKRISLIPNKAKCLDAAEEFLRRI